MAERNGRDSSKRSVKTKYKELDTKVKFWENEEIK